MLQKREYLNEKLEKHILNFSRRIAGSCKIKAVCICGDYASGFCNKEMVVEVLLVIHRFQPRLMSYVKTFDDRNILVFAVDDWVFERDVERGFLGEALAGRIIFPYVPLLNEEYLRFQEVKLKKRLIVELLENLVLSFPELSYEFRIKPEYFMYETMLNMTRVFPPLVYSLLNLMRKEVKKRNIELMAHGFSEALRELEKEGFIKFSNGYLRISEEFVEHARSRKVSFINFFRTAQKTTQRTLFTTLLGVFPKVMNVFSQSKELFLKSRKNAEEELMLVRGLEDPQRFLYIPTARGLVPLADRMDIESFVRKTLSAGEDVKFKIKRVGGVLNDVYLVEASSLNGEQKFIVKRFKNWSSFKWFPLALWTLGTRTFAVSGRSRLERECAINQFLHSRGYRVPRILHVNHNERLVFMEYVEGKSLTDVIKSVALTKKGRNAKQELAIISEVGEKVAEVHALGIALGDTKPENFMVKEREVYMMDFEQASRKGDKAWDIAEFLYYSGHYIPPFVGTHPVKLIAESFIGGYLKAGGDVKAVKNAGKPKYTKVFSIFTFPHVILAISNICGKSGQAGR